MKDIDSNWIQMQRQKTSEDNVLSLLRTPTPHQLNIPTITYLRRSSIAVMEQDVLKGNPVTSSVSDFLLHECLGRSWSRVVGNRRSRSVGTGLNELHRLTGNNRYMFWLNRCMFWFNGATFCLNGYMFSLIDVLGMCFS